MLYKVLLQRGTREHYEIVEAPDISTAEQASGGIVVALASRFPTDR